MVEGFGRSIRCTQGNIATKGEGVRLVCAPDTPSHLAPSWQYKPDSDQLSCL